MPHLTRTRLLCLGLLALAAVWVLLALDVSLGRSHAARVPQEEDEGDATPPRQAGRRWSPAATRAGEAREESDATPCLSGRVIDSSTGSPVSGAEVLIRNGEEAEVGTSATADKDGRFAIECSEDDLQRVAGDLAIEAEAEGYAALQRPLAADALGSDVDLRLDAMATITGIVVDEQGAPLVEESVQYGTGETLAETSREGRFSGRIAPGEHVVYVLADSGEEEEQQNRMAVERVHVGPGETVDVRLAVRGHAAYWLRAKVVDADGRSLAGLGVKIKSSAPDADPRVQALLAMAGSEETDEEGAFSIEVGSPVAHLVELRHLCTGGSLLRTSLLAGSDPAPAKIVVPQRATCCTFVDGSGRALPPRALMISTKEENEPAAYISALPGEDRVCFLWPGSAGPISVSTTSRRAPGHAELTGPSDPCVVTVTTPPRQAGLDSLSAPTADAEAALRALIRHDISDGAGPGGVGL